MNKSVRIIRNPILWAFTSDVPEMDTVGEPLPHGARYRAKLIRGAESARGYLAGGRSIHECSKQPPPPVPPTAAV